MDTRTLFLLFCTLIVSQIVFDTTAAYNGPGSNISKSSEIEILSSPRENFEANVKDDFNYDTGRTSIVMQLLQFYNNPYSPTVLKLFRMMLHGRSSFNFFGILRVIPYIVLALQKANDNSTRNMQDVEKLLGKFNLTSALENPENLAKIFSDPKLGNLATDAMKVLAGKNASETVEKLINEVKANAKYDIENGKFGINGTNLISTMLKSDNMKSLFLTEKDREIATVYINAFMNSMADSKNQRTILYQDDNNNSANGNIGGTMTDAVRAFFKTGHRIMNDKLQRISLDANQNVAKWREESTNGSNFGSFKSMVVNNAPNAILKFIASANALNNQHRSLFPLISHFFLPTGVAMDALKFMSLVTYVLLHAQRENMIPEIEKDKIQSIPGLNTEHIIDTLNNKETMKKIFPLQDQSNYSVAMLRFLAGPEAIVVDKFVDEIKRIKSGMNSTNTNITMSDLITNTEFVKRTISIINSIDSKLKNSLGLDLSEFKNEVVDEMKKNIVDETNTGYINTLVRALSTASAVGLQKTKYQFNSIRKKYEKDVDEMQMWRPSSTEPESIGMGLFRTVANNTPRPVLYGASILKNVMPNWYVKSSPVTTFEQDHPVIH